MIYSKLKTSDIMFYVEAAESKIAIVFRQCFFNGYDFDNYCIRLVRYAT